ncbi:MAG: hypothetical protein HY244_19820, partial [Rhizobiales bacterium]|nr:hypothetical protein [Hyphomicrobiales bacterium]
LTGLLLAVMTVAPLLYGAVILLYAVNVPVGDDYALLTFLNQFHVSSSTGEKIRLLLSLHNEHRILATRTVSLLVERTFGSLDFRILLLVGNAALVLTVIQVARLLEFGSDLSKWAILFLVVLQPQPEKLMFYPMANIGAHFGLLFAIIYLRCLLEKRHFMFLMLFYSLTIFSTGAGLFLVVIGAPVLAWGRKQTELIAHLVLSLVAFYLYFYGFVGNMTGLAYLFEHPIQAFSFFLRLLGGISAPPSSVAILNDLPLVFGLFLIGYFLFAASATTRAQSMEVKTVDLKRLVFLLYCILMLSLIVAGRLEIYHDKILTASLDGRYRIYGILFTAVVLVSALDKLRLAGFLGGRATTIVVLCALAFNVSWFSSRFGSMSSNAVELVEGMRRYVINHDPSRLVTGAWPRERALIDLDLTISSGLYKP